MSTATAPVDYATPDTPPGHIDWWLLGTAVVLAGWGLLMIVSASSVQADAIYGNALHYVGRQGVALAAGTLAAAVVLRLPWQWLRQGSYLAYGAACVGLLLVMTPLGNDAGGASRWIAIGPVNFQPSEVAKVAVVLVLAQHLSSNAGRMRDLVAVVFPALFLALVPITLVFLEPDFGTTVILSGLVGVLLFVAGLQLRYVVGLGGVGLGGLLLLAVAAPYRVARLASFTNPHGDAEDGGYQVVQAWIAMAHGELFGSGLGTGVAQSGFLPEAHTDFIAAVLAEELGAVGWLVMVACQGIILWRGLRIAERAPDLFGTLLASGITSLLGMQVLVNLGVVSGWLPNKGLVLPFMSYGSSAAMVHVLCVGLLLRVGLQSPEK